MRKAWMAVLAVGLVVVGWWAGSHHSTTAGDLPARPAASSGGLPSAGRAPRGDTGADDGEVAALRAQLRERDKLLGAMAVQSAAQQAKVEKAAESPTARAIGQLNQRLFSGP